MGNVEVLEKRCGKTVKLLIDLSTLTTSVDVNLKLKFDIDCVQFTGFITKLRVKQANLFKTDDIARAPTIPDLITFNREINDRDI